MKSFIVETLFTYGWENCWAEEDGTPITFPTRQEAKQELDDHLKSCLDDYKAGNLSEPYKRSEFRIRQAGETEERSS